MIDLERSLSSRFPRAFSPAWRPLTRPVLRGVARISRIDRINAFLQENGHLQGLAFVDAALRHLGSRYLVDPMEREHIPETGRVVIVANHPLGALDALSLLHLVGSVRRDVKVLANDMLSALAPMSDLLIPLRVFGGRAGAESIAAVEQALEAEQAVIVFPAGEVSRLTLTGVRDGDWRRGFLRFARRCQAPVLPVRIEGRNSALFYGASTLFKPLATAMLPREMFHRRRGPLRMRVGQPLRLEGEAMTSDRDLLRRVRREVYAIGRQLRHLPDVLPPVAHAQRRLALRRELAGMECIGRTSDGKQIYCGRLRHDSAVLQEIGRLRELSFRAVGEGSGRRLDLDRFDAWYEHILLWDASELEIAGAYRVARCAEVLASRGYEGLYSAGLFHFSPEFGGLMEQGMELGRSFVAPKYWGSRSLDYLWMGIGAYLDRHPELRYLFGPVSISAALPLQAREQLVAYYSRFYGDAAFGIQARNPFRFQSPPPGFGELDVDTSFRLLQDNLQSLGARVPTLYRQYTELCEPGGVRFLAFGVDSDFADSIDGLILLDLQRMRPKKRARYLGRQGTAPERAP